MTTLTISRLQADDSQQIVATCELRDGVVTCSGEKSICESLTRDGILDYSQANPKRLFPADGLKFLEQLPNHFRSGYLTASPVKED